MTPEYSFAFLKEHLDALPNQVQGPPGDVGPIGKRYREFLVTAVSRPGDVAVVEGSVVANIMVLLDQYFEHRKGRIYWHTPLEWKVSETGVAMEYRVDGPDKDPLTGAPCVLDKDWRKVACYTRLYRVKHKSAGDV